MTDLAPRVTAVVLCYGPEPWLEECLSALLGSTDVRLDIVLVDNGCTNPVVEKLGGWEHVHLVRPDENLGFAGGCNFGADLATGDFLALVNSDALVEPDALAQLVAVARRPSVGLATASLRLADSPDLMNSAGNPLHYLGFVWAGGLREPASRYALEREVALASGAALMLPLTLWRSLRGFESDYFAYHEDTELSLRVRHRGLSVLYVPGAVVRHHYQFSRNPQKLYLLERNRLRLVLTVYERRTLALLGPGLLATELGIAVLAAKERWFKDKARGWLWLWRHRHAIQRRRRTIQTERTLSDRDLARLFSPRMAAGEGPTVPAPVNALLAAYWAAVRPLLSRRPGGTG